MKRTNLNNKVAMSRDQPESALKLSKFLTSWEMLLVMGLSVSIALFSPENVLEESVVLAQFVTTVEAWIRPIAGYRQRSVFPEITGLYFSVMFLVTPVVMLYLFRRMNLILREVAHGFYRRPILVFPAMIAMIALCFVMPFTLYVWSNGSEVLPSIPIGSSKLALAATGWLAAGGIAWMLVPYGIGCSIVVVKKLWAIEKRG